MTDEFVAGSVARAADVRAAVAAAARGGRLDLLVNNAARMDGHSLMETDEVEWEGIMDVNAKGVFLCTRAAVGQFRTQAGLDDGLL